MVPGWANTLITPSTKRKWVLTTNDIIHCITTWGTNQDCSTMRVGLMEGFACCFAHPFIIVSFCETFSVSSATVDKFVPLYSSPRFPKPMSYFISVDKIHGKALSKNGVIKSAVSLLLPVQRFQPVWYHITPWPHACCPHASTKQWVSHVPSQKLVKVSATKLWAPECFANGWIQFLHLVFREGFGDPTPACNRQYGCTHHFDSHVKRNGDSL